MPQFVCTSLILVPHMHKAENNLVREFVRQLRKSHTPWGKVKIAREFSYQRGRADVLALQDKGNHLVAFEAKLVRWRDALHQAYRNTCFAHTSFVLLPRRTAMIAERYEAEFRRRNIGLCYLEKDEVIVVHSPEAQNPIEPWLLDQARAAARKNSHGPTRSRSSSPEVLRRT